MAFDNVYPRRKDWRRPLRGGKRWDRTCRNHGSCSWCEGNRRHSTQRRIEAAEARRN